MDSEDSYIDEKGLTKKHKSISIWAEEFQVFPVRVKGICRFEVSDTPSLLINKWRVDDKGKLVSDLTGKEVMVLYHKENRLDILL